MLDPGLVRQIRMWADAHAAPTAVEVWNFCKELLDAIVHSAGAAPFVQRLVDLEAVYAPPAGGLAQADGSIERAPWRTTRGLFAP